jgi:RNA polymerase sigma-B factor
MLRPPRRIQELCLELNRELGSLTQRLGRSPTIPELAAAVDATEADVIEALDAAESYWAVSLDSPTADGETLGTQVGARDVAFDAVDERVSLFSHLEALPERQRLIVQLRFVDGLTQSEIGARVGLSQMHVSRLLRTALTTLREAFGDQSMGDVAEFKD